MHMRSADVGQGTSVCRVFHYVEFTVPDGWKGVQCAGVQTGDTCREFTCNDICKQECPPAGNRPRHNLFKLMCPEVPHPWLEGYPIPGWGIPQSLARGGIPCWPGQEGSHTWPGGVPYPGVQPVRTWVAHQEPPLWDQWKYYGKEMGYPRVWTDWKHYLPLYFVIIIFVNELHYLLPLLCSIKKWNNSWHRI